MKNNNKFVCIGQITAAHGILGHIRVRSYANPPKKLFSYQLIQAETAKPLLLKLIRNDKNNTENTMFICQINGINDRNAAEAMAGTDIYIYRQDLAAIVTDELYIIDIEGATVYSAADEAIIGTVKTIVNYGAGDIVEIKTANELILVPFTKRYFPVVDIANNKIIMNFPEYN